MVWEEIFGEWCDSLQKRGCNKLHKAAIPSPEKNNKMMNDRYDAQMWDLVVQALERDIKVFQYWISTEPSRFRTDSSFLSLPLCVCNLCPISNGVKFKKISQLFSEIATPFIRLFRFPFWYLLVPMFSTLLHCSALAVAVANLSGWKEGGRNKKDKTIKVTPFDCTLC